MMDQIIVGAWMPSVELQRFKMQQDSRWKPAAHPWFSSFLAGSQSDSGIHVTAETALTHTPLWHGLTLLGGDAGSLPLQLKRKSGEQTIDVTNHEAYVIAAIRPNAVMCPSSWWEAMVVTSLLYGNAIAEVKRDGGRAMTVDHGGGLEMLPPASTNPWFDEDGKLWIETWITQPDFTRERRLIDPDDVFHLPSLTMDGFWGRGIIDVGRNRIGHGLGMNKQANRFMKNGMMPSWLFSYPINLDPEEGIAIEERLALHNAGLENTGRNLVLDNDVKAQQLGMTMEHAQFVELAKLDVQMVSSLLGVPAVMLNAMDKMTFSNAEESERWYINRTLRRWLNKITQELAAKLLTDRERPRMFFKHDVSPLLMGRLSERMEAYSKGIAARIFSPNEIRAKEGLNPYPEGDTYQNPNTTSFSESVGSDQDQNRVASQLRPLLKMEDHEVSEACRREANIVNWLGEFYRTTFLNQLLEVVPHCAGEYCEGRFRLWLKYSNHVDSPKRLGELVKAQAQTDSDRLAGILNAEFVAA